MTTTTPSAARPAARPRAGRRALALVFAVLAFVLATAAPASAHAVVTESTPPDQSKLPSSPPLVELTFSEAVTADLGGLKVVNSKGDQVDNHDSQQPAPNKLQVTLPPNLPNGTYVANYQVVSADGHAISGATIFGVGNGSLADVSDVVAKNDPTMEALGAIARFVLYLGALLAAGIAFFLGFIHDRAPDWGPLGTWIRACSLVAALASLLLVAVQAALATGNGLSAAFNTTNLREVLRQGIGWQTAFLLLGLGLVQGALVTRSRVLAQGLIFYGSIAIVSSFVWWGHATESPHSYLAVPSNVVHTATAAIWLGGLVGLAVVLRRRSRAAMTAMATKDELPAGVGDDTSGRDRALALTGDAGAVGRTTGPDDAPTAAGADPSDDVDTSDDTEAAATGDGDEPADDGDDALPVPGSLGSTVVMIGRFSAVAAATVIVLTLAGVALAWGEVGSLGALVDSTYGKLLLAKVAVVGVILFIAGFNRWRLLPWLLDDADGELAGDDVTPPSDATANRWRPLINTMGFELLGIVAVLAVTSVLVNTTPPSSVVVPSAPFQETQAFQDGTMQLTITPNRVGTNSFHLEYAGADGKPNDPVRQVTIEFRLPAKGIGPLTREFPKAGPGHFVLENVNDLSIAGTWQITVISRISDFDQLTNTFEDTIN